MRPLKYLTALIILIASSQTWSNPEEDRQLFIATFAANIPDVPISQYIHGSMMLSEDALDQYNSIMDFPPFQEMIDQGKKIWGTLFKNGQTFDNCFENKGVNVAGKFPYYDTTYKQVVTFEMALNFCLEQNGETKLNHIDPETMGALSAYARSLSDGMLMQIEVSTEEALIKYALGKSFYFRRIGQYNLACASCHLTNGGRYFRDELLSPTIGQAVHFPVFRGGERLYTLQMRYQRCMEAVGAVPFESGSEVLNNLEFFHSYLSNGLPLQSSVYRR
ncbi:MAG: sulfur oxidation c-type cytochrome SoxA [Proteobacteria bacterium]|nr:sulfur oxidation c-type cytochrome SoxA [Pseudomonadota bacterium]MDA1332203.1 sulfur oxidation c-type cytochrome SoxA [Pseudomonadota bacterium]